MPDIPAKVREISEQDFWSSLRPVRGAIDAKALAKAVALGRAGKKAAAYRALCACLRPALEPEWEVVRDKIASGPPPDGRVVEDALQNVLILPGAGKVDFGKRIDFRGPGLTGDALYQFQYLGWTRPVLRYFVRTGDERARAWLIDVFARHYAARNRLRDASGRDPRFCMLAMSGFQEALTNTFCAILFSGRVPVKAAEALLKPMLSVGRALHLRIRRFIIHNIHTAACFGLFFLARRMRVFRESVQWERRSLAYLVRHSEASFSADGCHMERSWGYMEHTLWRMQLAYKFARRTGGMGRHEQQYLRNLRKAYRWYAKTTSPGEMSPGFGDGGITDAGHVIDLALTLFPKGTDRSLGCDRTRSYLMRPSGFAIFRNGASQDSVYATLTFGNYCGWHGHFDCLSMNVWRGDTPLLDELGQFVSYEKALDFAVRAPEAHNQVLIDGAPYDSRLDDGAGDVQWHSDERIDYFSACHRAFRQAPPPPHARHRVYVASVDAVVRRTVLLVKDPGYLLVMDSVQGEHHGRFNRAISAYWHSASSFRVLAPGLVRTEGSKACLLAWARMEGLARMDTSVDYTNEESLGYGDRHCLRVRRWMPTGHRGCLGFVTLLYPFRGSAPETAIRALATHGGEQFRAEALEIVTPTGKDVILLNPERLDGFSYRGRPVPERAVIRLGNRRGRVVVN